MRFQLKFLTTSMAALAAAALLTGAAMAQPAQAPKESDPVAQACKDLAGPKYRTKFSQIPGAVTQILSARLYPKGGDGSVVEKDWPENCRIEGQIASGIGFLLRLPTREWNGKFMMGGCGGPCGNYLTDRVDPALVRNYAVVVTDMGHKGGGWGFGFNDSIGMIDFGFRSTHLTAVVSKVIISEFYGKASARNYFWGCSTGGRQALVSAQRFPQDFEGILGGAPPLNQTGHQFLIAEWGQRANTTKDGKQILTAAKLPMIHNAVLAACDELDGLKDGVLQHPPACKWEPKQLACAAGSDPAKCLTPEEVGVVEKIYAGASWPDGTPMYYGQSGLPKGSELKWRGELAPLRDGDSMFKYFDLFYPRGPNSSDLEFDWERDFPNLAVTEPVFSPMNPDMRNFKAAGGKFILYTGWDDTCCRGEATINHYETITRAMGGREKTKDFMRLFLPAGMDHCRYGIGGGEVDWITALENWVEKGQAPDEVTAYHMVKEPYPSAPRAMEDPAQPGSFTRMARHPLAKNEYDRAHPVYAYPDWPMYSGSGDPANPANWKKAPQATGGM